MNAVANLVLVAARPNQDAQRVVVSIGIPYENGLGAWACPVALDGLYARLADIHGADSLQALCLALTLVRDLLEDVLEKGGSLSFEDGTSFNPGEYFGKLGGESA